MFIVKETQLNSQRVKTYRDQKPMINGVPRKLTQKNVPKFLFPKTNFPLSLGVLFLAFTRLHEETEGTHHNLCSKWMGGPSSNLDLLDWWMNIKYDLKSRGRPVSSPSDPRLQFNFLDDICAGFKVFLEPLFIYNLHK